MRKFATATAAATVTLMSGLMLTAGSASAAPRAEMPAEGLSPAGVQACGGTAVAPPGFWGKEAKSSCGTSGYRGYKKGYKWRVVNGDVTVCVQAWGFNTVTNVGQWYALGCGQGATGAVPWGNNVAHGKIRAQSIQLPFAAMVTFDG